MGNFLLVIGMIFKVLTALVPDWLLLYNNVTNFKHWFAVVCGTAFEIEIYGKELPAMAIKRVFQKEPVLSIAACLALVSSCFVLPDAEYLGYIDLLIIQSIICKKSEAF